ncbi:hypothetical protein JMJ56_19565 [Belnapia sp. T18]|uniref:Integrase n=1 Tax=Belnapia arida TaxID=2804533 RepID=A0ABS1U6Q0_9PROT|nr:hypothetical protein [Belnapia arida]
MAASSLTTSTQGSIATLHAGPFARAAGYASTASADATRKGYGTDWTCFAAWCQGQGLEPCPLVRRQLAATWPTRPGR